MKTLLYPQHQALGAKFIVFGEWEMPLQYSGIIPEHLAVRKGVGLFDVSHMGRILVQGKDAEKFLDYLSTNQIAGKSNYSAIYTVWCNPNGGCVEDLIVYKKDAEHFFVVVNAANRQKDLNHLKLYSENYQVEIQERFQDDGILALQGPIAKTVIELLFPIAIGLKPMHFVETEFRNTPLIISATGYTGAGGVELYTSNDCLVDLWNLCLEKGKEFGIQPIGLGARDTLRLEMGYALYGHEINDSIAPTESVSAWTVKWTKTDFLGKDALLKLKEDPKRRSEYGIILLDPGIARENYPVIQEEKEIGRVTSGSYSPILNKSIAIILANKKLHPGDLVEVKIRNNFCKAQVMDFPFIVIP